ncbi:MAG: adenylate kinase [Planctomycetaceae bacterium]|nr:adenylate kinase [Planctomycetaceae bacterium]
MYVVLIGRPGVGKGTQSKRLAELLGSQHIATGELLRDAQRQGTPLGKQVGELIDNGNLVPDELVIDLVRERLEDASANQGCIFDGIPRTVHQAGLLENLLVERGDRVGLAMELVVPEQLATDRMLQRAKAEGRADDTPETIKHRMQVYTEQTHPLVNYYQQAGVLQSLDGSGSPDEVFEVIKTCALQAQNY